MIPQPHLFLPSLPSLVLYSRLRNTDPLPLLDRNHLRPLERRAPLPLRCRLHAHNRRGKRDPLVWTMKALLTLSVKKVQPKGKHCNVRLQNQQMPPLSLRERRHLPLRGDLVWEHYVGHLDTLLSAGASDLPGPRMFLSRYHPEGELSRDEQVKLTVLG